MELYSVNKTVYLNDLWMDRDGDISIIENIDCQDEEGTNSIKIRVLTGTSKDAIYFEDEYNFSQGDFEDPDEYFTCLVFRPLTGYRNDAMIDKIAKEQNGLEL